jgi:RNA polymerase sigma-70 factor (ECF subfamily)
MVSSSAAVSDEALMLDFQRGSREAFEDLFGRYQPVIYRFFHRRLNSPDRAQDLTQETFLAVVNAAVRYEPRATVRSYLYGIAFNLLSAERRKGNRRQESSVEADALSQQPAADTSFWVRQALERLEETEREILMLREYEQLSYDEIARLLRIPVNTVRSRLFRARNAMKTLLERGRVHESR